MNFYSLLMICSEGSNCVHNAYGCIKIPHWNHKFTSVRGVYTKHTGNITAEYSIVLFIDAY